MGLLDDLRDAVAIADSETKDIQSTVTLKRYLSDDDGYGSPSYAPDVTLQAIVDWKQKQVRTKEGILSVSRAIVTFLDAAALRDATDGNGIDDDKDVIVLPDGTTGPILDLGGFIDRETTHPLATEVILG
jgi:hypothetical protein